ncbi:coproporphyrinogen-III oxidase family protein [Kitasatospora sp. NPDC093102]|uniref:coproporphyrinogen-III oxidase family protein n=1 Tax=Kitasatospora sp. NPDC093102 TaxID=3155069 RepID=UPI00342480A5
MAEKIIRRNIHTYPFKYRHHEYDEYFRPENAVLYLHVPFCITKCGFCDYTVYINRNEQHFAQYVDALEREVRAFAANRAFPAFRVDAVYFGGGTPGILTGDQTARLLDVCRESFEFNEGAEIGLEFDPSTVDEAKIACMREAGFTRLSVGVQAFDDRLLTICNRSHDRATAERAFRTVVDGGFTHTNIDLIFPLPDQSVDDWKRSVDRAIELEPACITAYGLEIWPKTAFHSLITSGKMALPTAQDERRMYEYAIDALEAAGFVRRSSTGYFHPDRCADYSRFLEYYWRTWPMIGFGVSSKSVIHDRLFVNVKPLKKYYEMVEGGQIPLDFATYLTKEQEMRRVMIRGLKMCEVNRPDFRQRFGVTMETVFGPEIEQLIDKGWLEPRGTDVYALTRLGQLLSTNVYELFYAPEDLSPAEGDEVRFGISELVE